MFSEQPLNHSTIVWTNVFLDGLLLVGLIGNQIWLPQNDYMFETKVQSCYFKICKFGISLLFQSFPGVSSCHGQSSWWWDWSSPRTSWEYFSCFGWACLCGIWGICFVTMTCYLDFSNSQPVKFNNLNHKKASSILCWSLSMVAAAFHISRGRILKIFLSAFKVFGLRGGFQKICFFGILCTLGVGWRVSEHIAISKISFFINQCKAI